MPACLKAQAENPNFDWPDVHGALKLVMPKPDKPSKTEDQKRATILLRAAKEYGIEGITEEEIILEFNNVVELGRTAAEHGLRSYDILEMIESPRNIKTKPIEINTPQELVEYYPHLIEILKSQWDEEIARLQQELKEYRLTADTIAVPSA